MKNNANKSYLKKLSTHDEQPQKLGLRGWLRRLFGLKNEADIRGTIEELIEQERDRLYTLAVRELGSAADAEDAVQEALIRAWRCV